MELQFNGFDEKTPWKVGTDAYVQGHGQIPPGDVRDYDEDTALFLLATHLWTPPTPAETSPHPPDDPSPPDDPPPLVVILPHPESPPDTTVPTGDE